MRDSGNELDGKVVLVTGAASGIGWATARLFASDGATVFLADIDLTKLTAKAAELGAKHHAMAVDLSDKAAAQRMVDTCIATTSRLDILVNCAGITTNNGLMIQDQTPADLQKIID